MSTQTDTIREALMEGGHVARIQALAALSELETQPKEGLSDEEIDRIASEHDQDELNDSRQDGYVTSADSHAFRLGIKCGLRYACDKGLLSPSVDVRGLEADNERLRAAGNEMCMLLCLFYKEAAVTMPETARKDLLAKINAWDAAAKEQCFTPTNTETPTSEGSTTLAPTNTEGNG